MTPAVPGWPSISVTMLVHRAVDTSSTALRSVLDNGYPGSLDVLVREQGGDDQEFEALHQIAEGDARVQLERGDNLGFCDGHERLLGRSTGELVVLVNDDAFLEPGYLASIARAFEDPGVGAAQGLLVAGRGPVEPAAPVDTTGLVLGRSRRVGARDRGRSQDQALGSPRETWGVDGAVMALRRAAIDDARAADGRLFPAEFGSYMEDVELSWRLRRLGWHACYVPDAVAAHARGTNEANAASLSDRIRARRTRSLDAHVGGFVNLRLAQLRHDRISALARDLPWWLPRETAAWVALAVVTPRAVLPVVRRLAAGTGPSWRARRELGRRIRSR